MAFDTLFARLNDAFSVTVENWLPFTIVAMVVGCAVWVAAHLLNRKQIVNFKKRVELNDDQLACANAEIEKLGKDLEALKGEHGARQDLEALVASLREQLANAQKQLLTAARPTVHASPASRHIKFGELFGSGNAIDGKLTKEEAGRLIAAVHELTDLMKSKVGAVQTHGEILPRTGADSSAGWSWWLYVSEKGISHTIDLVAAYRADIIAFANSLEAVVTRQPDLEFRLRKIVGNVSVIAYLLNIVGGFVRSLERLNDGEKYKPAVIEMALGGPFQIMSQAQMAVDEWMQLFIEQRAPAVRQEAAAFL